jgi:SAM-dependent methyltransferase
MANVPGASVWQGTDAYEAYMGRWSRPMAQAFIAWFGVPKAARWLDVGCGTGALISAVLDAADPIAATGIDTSTGFVDTAKAHISDPRARFEVGDALALPVATGGYDAVVAGLVLNHVSDPALAAAEMVRAARPGGAVGAYVWDYSGEMQLVRFFWEAVAATNPNAAAYDPRPGYHICQPDPLADLFRSAGLGEVEVDAIDLPLRFRDFDDYWLPHTMTGPAAPQRYVAALDDDRKAALREQLRVTLPIAADGTIDLIGRAWAVRGKKSTG